MISRHISSELASFIDKRVRVRGWINNVRSLGKVHFLILRDRGGFLQIVIDKREEFEKIAALQPGSVITVIGDIQATPKVELGYEMMNPEITVEVPIREVPPIEYYKPEIASDLEVILDHRSIALRNRQIQAVFSIQAAIAEGFRLFMVNEVKAVEYFAPCMIGASSEGGAEFFTVDYFGYTATLAQSSQLYKQMMVGVNERVFALMPFFRAENSHTPRHLTEGKQFEFEMGFFDHWHEVLDVQERCMKSIVAHLHAKCRREIATLGGQIIRAPADVPFPRLTFQEAQELFYERTGIDERDEPDLSPAAERELCAYAQEKFGTDLIFVIDWKTEKRPFYAYPKEEDPSLTNTFDLLCNGVEITSGGQRRHTYETMIHGIESKGMNPNAFEDYLTIFKYGMPPHGGFGMGLERLTMTLLGLKNIRESSLFPSDPKRIAGRRLRAKIFFGGENIRNEILRLLKDNQMEFTHLVHEATPTSEDSAKVRGTKMEEGIKALILRGKQSKKNFQFNLPSHAKLDMKAVAEIVGEKCDFEDPKVIQERFGLLLGGVPPFGPLLNIDTYFDRAIGGQEVAAFNVGLLTESVVMKSADLFRLVSPKIASFSRS